MPRGLDVNLPVARRAPELSSERLFVTVPLSYAKDRRVQIDDEMVGVDVLGERMRQAMQGATDLQVYLRADGGVSVQHAIEVMDQLKAGGVEKVGIVARQPGER
jgi:biopolymer transport protein ExbD